MCMCVSVLTAGGASNCSHEGLQSESESSRQQRGKWHVLIWKWGLDLIKAFPLNKMPRSHFSSKTEAQPIEQRSFLCVVCFLQISPGKTTVLYILYNGPPSLYHWKLPAEALLQENNAIDVNTWWSYITYIIFKNIDIRWRYPHNKSPFSTWGGSTKMLLRRLTH